MNNTVRYFMMKAMRDGLVDMLLILSDEGKRYMLNDEHFKRALTGLDPDTEWPPPNETLSLFEQGMEQAVSQYEVETGVKYD